jgi:hypothetical protein
VTRDNKCSFAKLHKLILSDLKAKAENASHVKNSETLFRITLNKHETKSASKMMNNYCNASLFYYLLFQYKMNKLLFLKVRLTIEINLKLKIKHGSSDLYQLLK